MRLVAISLWQIFSTMKSMKLNLFNLNFLITLDTLDHHHLAEPFSHSLSTLWRGWLFVFLIWPIFGTQGYSFILEKLISKKMVNCLQLRLMNFSTSLLKLINSHMEKDHYSVIDFINLIVTNSINWFLIWLHLNMRDDFTKKLKARGFSLQKNDKDVLSSLPINIVDPF